MYVYGFRGLVSLGFCKIKNNNKTRRSTLLVALSMGLGMLLFMALSMGRALSMVLGRCTCQCLTYKATLNHKSTMPNLPWATGPWPCCCAAWAPVRGLYMGIGFIGFIGLYIYVCIPCLWVLKQLRKGLGCSARLQCELRGVASLQGKGLAWVFLWVLLLSFPASTMTRWESMMAKERMARCYLEWLAEWPKGLPFMHMAVLLLLWNNGQQASKKTCFGLFFWLSLGLWGNGFCIYSIGWPQGFFEANQENMLWVFLLALFGALGQWLL